MTLGYDGKLYVLAFDHRGSFQKKFFGVTGAPTPEETQRIVDAKSVIFEGMEAALAGGVDHAAAGVLVDEQFGAEVARTAKTQGLLLSMPCEKSGQDEFDFEYGADFGAHIEAFDPSFTKVLVRFNPAGDGVVNARQAGPDIWKIEGIDATEECRVIAEQCRTGGRDQVACVVLGRGADDAAVDAWLRAARGVPGYCGFAIGRSIWWEPLKGYVDGKVPRQDTAASIARNYRRFVDVYEKG